VTVIAKLSRWDKALYTGLATLIAEELDATGPQMRVEARPPTPKL
jgi:hypothetical protein